MTEQEKQAIREQIEIHKRIGNSMIIPPTVIERLLDALDERDREVERLNEENEGYTEFLQGWHDDYNELKEENQRLRNALEEIRDLPDVDADHRGTIARQALSGEEKEDD